MDQIQKTIEQKADKLEEAFLFKGNRQDALRIAGLRVALKLAEEIDALQSKCKKLFKNGRFDEFHVYKSDLTFIQKKYKRTLEFLSNNG